MITDRFGLLLEELGKALNIPNLAADENHSCLLKIPPENVMIQLEIDRKTGDFLIIGSDLGEIPRGKYRENLFFEALRANALLSKQYGVLAFSFPSEHLILFEMISMNDISGTKIAEFLPNFINKAKKWKNAIETSSIPAIIEGDQTPAKPGGIFGLTR